ncbi:phage holin [Streptococcus cuniculi]|uniref:Phage holin n=1 Tax=Streptococcus cuniculi TaxID=1432788 RepID=A0A4Y9JA82_9STRE|nr:phage holin [Streptococcus cuniculi]MBF0778193.1 phage holin [Streptococcus cuniculi]TFU97933.1 phage holin [Streptococcus cuniculi]
MKINWKIRFTKQNKAFISRFALAVIVPVLAYLGLKFEDLTSWQAVGKVLLDFVANPYLIGLAIVNAINILPDPTTAGLSDSERAMGYERPNK